MDGSDLPCLGTVERLMLKRNVCLNAHPTDGPETTENSSSTKRLSSTNRLAGTGSRFGDSTLCPLLTNRQPGNVNFAGPPTR